jgi:hypothetical protein
LTDISDEIDPVTASSVTLAEPGIAELDDVLEDDQETFASSAWSRWDGEAMPKLPKVAAVRRAYEACVATGLPDGFAWTLANAAADPAAVRVGLNAPRVMNAVGGVFEFIELDLFTPAVSPLVTNHRAFGQRVYPAGGAVGVRPPLHGPASAPGVSSTILIQGADPAHVIDVAERTRQFVLNDNALAESIRERGIVLPVDVVYTEIEHTEGEDPPVRVLSTAEGSSRVTNAHEILGISQARELLYDLPGDVDTYRRKVNTFLLKDPYDAELSVRQAARARGQRNALLVRARVILRFIPAEGSRYTFAEALSGYLGMIHVDGPKQWSNTGKNEAMAEAVLNALHRNDQVTQAQRDYLAGLLSPTAAAAVGLPVETDAQAAYVLATLLDPAVRQTISPAIRDVTATARVTGARRAEVVAELALRPIRSLASVLPQGDPARTQIENMAPAYRRACRMSRYSAGGWAVTGRTPDQLLDAALAELSAAADNPEADAWAARVELAALAQFHLTRSAALRREPFGSGGQPRIDKRGPGDILAAMLTDELGVRLLYQAVVDGRAGVRPRVVDDTGALVKGGVDGTAIVPDPDGTEIEITDSWLRYEAFPTHERPSPAPTAPKHETPEMALARLKSYVDQASSRLEEHVDAIERITDEADSPVIERQGWANEVVLARLNDVIRRLTYWDGLARRVAARSQL